MRVPPISFDLRPSSIRIRLLLASTVVQVVLLSLLLANSVRLMNNAMSASLETTIGQTASMLHAMATAYGEQRRLDALEDVLGELLADADEGLLYVRIRDARDDLLVSAGMPDLTHVPEPNEHRRRFFETLLADDLVHVRRQLLLARNEVGTLQFGVSVSVLAAAREAIMQQGLAIAIAEILLTFVLLSSLGYLLTRNLRLLLEGSRAIASGFLDHRVESRGKDELAVIADHFNVMAATLQNRIAELQDTAERLQASEERYALALRGSNDGLWDWDIDADDVYYSERFCQILGVEPGSLSSKPEDILAYLHPHEVEAYRQRLIDHLKGNSNHFIMELRARLPDGAYRWVLMRGVADRDEDLRAYRMAGSLGDIDLRKRAEQQLVHDALHDGLTGLPNRAMFIEHANRALAQRRRGDLAQIAVLAINLERFSLVNDSYGHLVGDELLRRIGAHIAALMRDGDVCARVGGDQFAVLLNGVENSIDALRICEQLVALPAFSPNGNGQQLHPRCRVGVAISDNEREDAESLLRDADNALHKARRSDTGPIEFFQTEMHAAAVRALQVEAELRKALTQGGLQTWYQPIVELANRRPTGFEALVRWPHPTLGLLSPAEFIPLAEALDLIHDIGMIVLERTCTDLQAWSSQLPFDAPLRVSVNLSARQLARPDLAAELLDVIDRSGVAHDRIRFEVTESVLAHPDGPAIDHLHALRAAGIDILIDDFGTGYSTLSYLHTMPCNQVKLDGSFVRSLPHDQRLRAIVRHSIELAHDLGMTVVAECIEDEAQLEILRAMGCDFGQGYLFSRPLDGDATLRHLQSLHPEPGR
ncbi:MAG: EAL domain-containing protein [Rhodocyclaceae bacterium]|nr:EAL domain-containing protein [Thauera sp.]MCP5225438.1 EAL domain-containing protein [Thauera sp.]RTL27452.1 MAG: EAL domain-containing protein [Rhodocyclaceae bacterium]